MSDNSMLYVIKDIEGMSSNRENDRNKITDYRKDTRYCKTGIV